MRTAPPIGPSATRAESICWHLDDTGGHDRRWRAGQFARLPDRFGPPLARRYVRAWDKGGACAANTMLREAVDLAEGYRYSLAADEDDLRAYAKARADECSRTAGRIKESGAVLAAMIAVAQRVGVAPPDLDRITPKGARARLVDDLWWRRALRRSAARAVEKVAIGLGLVHRRAGVYASDEAVARRRQQTRRNRDMLQATEAENELGQCYTLAALSDLGVSNPVIRRAELMTRIAGFETVARGVGHVGMFYTLTTPSKYHPRLSASCGENPSYDGSTPRDAQLYLRKLWGRIRSKLARDGLVVYGFRVAEPHHDGTPHWHMLFFMAPDHAERVTEIMRAYALAEDGDESGAAANRFRAVPIDWGRGSAAGYIAKYIAKNITGLGGVADFADDETGQSAADSSERVAAWAACWGIRQYQSIGGPPVTVWRELRRLDWEGGGSVLDQAAAAADAGSWGRFVEVMGGPGARRADMPVSLWRVWTDEPGRYGEAKGDQITGLESAGEHWQTRVHTWEIRRAAPAAPWSTVNNCTEVTDGRKKGVEAVGHDAVAGHGGGGERKHIYPRACKNGTTADGGGGTAARRGNRSTAPGYGGP